MLSFYRPGGVGRNSDGTEGSSVLPRTAKSVMPGMGAIRKKQQLSDKSSTYACPV